MENINLSVIIPVYNAEKTIKRAVNSISYYKENDIEIILVVDGALDNSLKICNSLKEEDNRIKVIYQENKGTLSARLTGIKNSRGKYLMFMDSDDEYLNGFMLNAIWNNCVKIEIFNKIDIKEKNVKYGEDLMMNLEIFSNIDSALFINDIFYKYNTNSSSINQSKDKKKWLRNLQDAVEIYTSFFYYIKIWNMDSLERI